LPDGRRGLIDTGGGPAAQYPEKERRLHGLGPGWPLGEALAAGGVAPGDLDFIVLSHLHWDHAGGAVTIDPDGAPAPAFPRAEHFIHTWEWADAISGNPLLYKSYPPAVTQALHRLPPDRRTLLDHDETEVRPGVHVLRSGGHTRGHCVVLLEADTLQVVHPAAGARDPFRAALFTADVCPTRHHLRMVFQTAYDTFPLDTRAWKRTWLPRADREKILLLFDHDPEIFGGTIRADNAKEFVMETELAAGRSG
jgi:glyoxylase-like metal-dependent hydrolase (beta-lactamase superfamily II)